MAADLLPSNPAPQVSSSKLTSPVPVCFSSLTPEMSVFTLGYLLCDHVQVTFILDPDIPGS